MTTTATIAATLVLVFALRSVAGPPGSLRPRSSGWLQAISIIGSATFFMTLALVIASPSWFDRVDRSLLEMAAGLRTRAIVLGSLACTSLVTARGLTILWLVVTGFLLWRSGRQAALLFSLISIGGLMYKPLKLVIGRARPDDAQALIVEHGLAFPSGHALASTTVFVGVCWAIHQMTRSPVIREAATLVTMTLLIWVPLSRLILGVHWLSDIVGGMALGAAWTSGLFLLDRRRQAGSPASAEKIDS